MPRDEIVVEREEELRAAGLALSGTASDELTVDACGFVALQAGDMEAARALYEDLGFEEIPPYYHNPIAGAHYLKVRL